MAKVRVYLRVGKKIRPRSKDGAYRVSATERPSLEPVTSGNNWLPTAAFALDLDIPDVMFDRAGEVLAEVIVKAEDARIAAEVKTPEDPE